MRQRRDLLRHAEIAQAAGNVRLPGGRALQTFVKPVGLSQLKADARDRVAKVRGRCLFAEGVPDAPLVRVAGLPARREAAQQFDVARLGFRHPLLAQLRGEVGVEMQNLVHQSEMAVVVQQPRARSHLGVDPYPEAHVRLQFRRIHEGTARRRPGRRWHLHRIGRPRRRREQRDHRRGRKISRRGYVDRNAGDLARDPTPIRISSRRSSGRYGSRPS